MLEVRSCWDVDSDPSTNCAPKETIAENLFNIHVTTKVVAKYFDLDIAMNGNGDGLVWHGNKQWISPLQT